MKKEEEIIYNEEKLLQALRDSDINAMEELIHDKLIFNGPNGELINKEMDISVYKSGGAQVETMDCMERKIEIFDDTAVVSTIVYLKGSFMGHLIDGKARFFRTWKKIGDQWIVIGGASVNLI